ncbi:MAG: HD domain-containing protein [Candidatus Peregrinibacteria bacterium]
MQWTEFQSHIRHLPESDMERVRQAFELSEELHSGQLRKSGEPYFTHPLATADMLADMGADADTLIAALLHDTVEDTEMTVAGIRERFGATVADLIDGITKLTPEEVEGRPSMDERIESLRKIFTMLAKDVRIIVIKLADRLHNMRTAEYISRERREALADETIEVYTKIADRLCMQDLRDELEELCLAVLDPALLAQLRQLRERGEETGKKITSDMEKLLRNSAPPKMTISARFEQKSWESLREQMAIGGAAASGISAVSVVFLAQTPDECYRILGLLHALWQREMLSFADFMNHRQINGYQGLHTTIILEDGTRVRCKIRTAEMHAYARRGITTLCFGGKPFGVLDHLPWAARIGTLSRDSKEQSMQFWESLKSDILQESIVVHGPDDETKLLPKGATALDGAFYLFGAQALRTKEILVNGVAVPFFEELAHACSISVNFENRTTVELSWLNSVRTGVAAALIRQGLARAPQCQKILLGKALLKGAVRTLLKIELEELDLLPLEKRLTDLSIPSLSVLYEQLAEGKVQAEKIVAQLFPQSKKQKEGAHCRWILKITVPPAIVEVAQKIVTSVRPRTLTIRRTDIERISLQAECDLTLQQAKEMRLLLRAMLTDGQWTLRTKHEVRGTLIAAIVLVILWGLDPVLSKMILNEGVTSAAFTMIRAWSIVLFASIVLLSTYRQHRFSRLPLFSFPSIWIAGIAFALINVFTYLTLEHGSPVLYNTILRGNAVILSLPFLLQHQLRWKLIGTIGLTAFGFFLLTRSSHFPIGVLSAIGVLFSFSIYTIASSRFQSHAHVLARYPQFLFFTSLIAAFLLLMLPAFGPIPFPGWPLTALIAVYCICFIGITYIIFFSITHQSGYYSVSPWITSSLLITFLAQTATMGLEEAHIVIPAALALVLGSLIAARGTMRPTLPLSDARSST